MWDYVGIVRSNHRLERALRRVELMRNEVEPFYKKTRVTEGLIELRNLVQCAELIVRCGVIRPRGGALDFSRRIRILRIIDSQ